MTLTSVERKQNQYSYNDILSRDPWFSVERSHRNKLHWSSDLCGRKFFNLGNLWLLHITYIYTFETNMSIFGDTDIPANGVMGQSR